jgi:hypothetical protein
MTQREFFNAVINANISADITAFAQERVAHLDTVNSNRKAKGTPTQRENAETMAKILDGVEYGVQYTASALAEMFGLSTAKASALAQKFVANGNATVADVKVKGKGKVKGYTFTAPETEGEGQGENLDTEN